MERLFPLILYKGRQWHPQISKCSLHTALVQHNFKLSFCFHIKSYFHQILGYKNVFLRTLIGKIWQVKIGMLKYQDRVLGLFFFIYMWWQFFKQAKCLFLQYFFMVTVVVVMHLEKSVNKGLCIISITEILVYCVVFIIISSKNRWIFVSFFIAWRVLYCLPTIVL